jgi:hypothetical protein
MSALENDLGALAGEIAWPTTPDIGSRVITRIAAAPVRPRRSPWRIALVCALAVLLPAGSVLAISSDARDAVRDWLGIDGVEIRLVETLPPTPPARAPAGADLGLGKESTTRKAAARLPFRPFIPRALGSPDAVWLNPSLNQISLVYVPRRDLPQSQETGVGMLVMELPARLEPGLFLKLRTKDTRVIRLRVRGAPAVGLEGAPHTVLFLDEKGAVKQDRTRLAGNVLLVQQDKLLVRMESALTVRQMARIAESLRPLKP